MVFLLSSFVSQEYSDFLGNFILGHKILGIVAYIIAVILAIVVAPLTSIPFIPLVVGYYGVFWTVVLSVISWTIGSLAAFWIARRFGVPVVEKLVPINEKRKIFYKNIPEKRLFWYLIFLRIIIPVDILSYMLGLFTNISWKIFAVTTFLGVIPAIAFLSLFGNVPVEYQFILFLAGSVLFILFLFARRLLKNRKKYD
jgi:uncharacterized membrane protein YdjX (TVP38/TMEM64 family)